MLSMRSDNFSRLLLNLPSAAAAAAAGGEEPDKTIN